MAYIKYKEVTKYFNFSKALDKSQLPKYVKEYVFDDEIILTAYKTSRDHGLFTTKKIVLFDNYGMKKQIYMIPYKSISSCSVIFYSNRCELSLFLDSGYPLRLKFVNMKNVDKLRLRVLYTCIMKIVNNQKADEEEIKRLIADDFHF